MAILKRGSVGEDVEKIQIRLEEVGFPPGPINGKFGIGTESAVINFQRSKELLDDGIVGPKTVVVLFEGVIDKLEMEEENIIPKITASTVSKIFDANTRTKRNIKNFLPNVLDALEEQDLIDKITVLMSLASIRAETAGFEPISEGKSKFNTSQGGHPFDLYDNREDLGNRGRPDGANFKGRGFIQLTGRFNYTKFSKILRLGNDLVKNPELANDPTIASKLLALFIREKEREVKVAILLKDFKWARRLVNGGSHGITKFITAYKIGDRLIT